MKITNVNIEESWYAQIKEEFNKEYFLNLKKFLIEEKNKFTVYQKVHKFSTHLI